MALSATSRYGFPFCKGSKLIMQRRQSFPVVCRLPCQFAVQSSATWKKLSLLRAIFGSHLGQIRARTITYLPYSAHRSAGRMIMLGARNGSAVFGLAQLAY